MTNTESGYAEWVGKAPMEVYLHYPTTTRAGPDIITNNI